MPNRPARLLHDTLLQTAERVPDRVALVALGVPRTYRELRDEALALAGALRQRGLCRGDRVAIYMENGWECAVAIYGVLLAGGVFMVVNPQTKQDKLEYILTDSGAAFLLTEARLARSFVPAMAAAPALRGAICADELPGAAPAVERWADALRGSDPRAVPAAETISVDLAALIYTSGSTGRPKGVMMTHQAMVFTAYSLLEYLRLDETHRILDVLPLAFDYGLYQLLMSVTAGATLVLERSFTYPAQILERMREQQVTVFPGVPTIFAMLLSMHRNAALSFPSVRRVTNTAAALAPSAVPRLREIFPSALLFRMYGLTECKRVCYLEPEELDRRPDSVGKAIPGTEAFLLSPDGRPVGPNEVGILHVRGAHVMLGYWNQPEKTAEMLKPGRHPSERVLCTHDWFRQDEAGYLYFVGRSDDIIKTRGEKVSPVEVENALCAIPGVREAAVIGVPDELLGQAIRAFVVLDPRGGLTERELKQRCAARLESFMVPRDVLFVDELPVTDTGKVRKKSLADAAE